MTLTLRLIIVKYKALTLNLILIIIMKASVQYNDIIGTVAADVSDWYSNSLQCFLKKSFAAYDADRYSCRGCTAYIGGSEKVYVSFICLDRESNEFVKFRSQQSWSFEDFFNLFKRFEIVIGKDISELPEEWELESYNLGNGKQEA